MTPAERQAELDNISAEDLEKVRRITENNIKVEIEDLLLAEFAIRFGWQAYRDVQADLVSSKEMMTLLAASRKLELAEIYRNAQAALIGAGSAQSKKPSQTFSSMTKKIIKGAEADT